MFLQVEPKKFPKSGVSLPAFPPIAIGVIMIVIARLVTGKLIADSSKLKVKGKRYSNFEQSNIKSAIQSINQ